MESLTTYRIFCCITVANRQVPLRTGLSFNEVSRLNPERRERNSEKAGIGRKRQNVSLFLTFCSFP
jgi:hypothetical protein